MALLSMDGLFFRSRSNNFEGDDGAPTWSLPDTTDRLLGQWQLAWAADGSALAVATATGAVYLLDRQGVSIAAGAYTAPTEGIAGLAVHSEVAGAHTVLCVTHSGKLYCLSASGSENTLPPVAANLLPAGSGAKVVTVCTPPYLSVSCAV